MMQRVSLKTIIRDKELWLLVLLGVLYFHRPLFLGETLFFRDLGSNILLQKQLLVDFMKAMELPLWNPYLYGGQPYWAHVPYFPLYPANLLYLFLPFFKAFNVTLISHVIGCSVCAYLFSRVIGLHQTSSFVAGIIYGFCGYTLSLISHGCRLLAMPYLPLLFLFWHLFLLEGKKKWFIITVIVGVIQVLAGASETNVMSLLSLLGWTLFYPYPRTSIFRRVVCWSLLGTFIVGIASFQIFPTVEMILQSSRGHKMGYTTFSYWSLSPKRLPELAFPGFLGRIDTLPVEKHFWGHKVVDQGIPYILSIYFGWIALTLAIVGGLRKNTPRPPSRGDKDRDSVFPFRARIFLLALFAFSLLLSLGRFLPFFQVLYQYVPLISLFRHPIKLLTAGILPLAVLAGYGSELLFGGLHPPAPLNPPLTPPRRGLRPLTPPQGGKISAPSLKMSIVLWGIAGILLIITATFLLSDNFTNRFQEVFFEQSGGTPPYPPQGEIARGGVKFSFLHASAIWLLMILLYQYHRIKRRQWQHWILAGILAVDLLAAGKPVNPSALEGFFTKEPDLVQDIRRKIGEGRLFRTKSSSEYTVSVPSDNVVWLYRWNLEILDSYLAAFYRFPVIFHEDLDGLVQVHLVTLKSRIDSLPWERRLPLLSAGGVTLILTSDKISIPGVHRIAEIPNRSDMSLYLYQNETAAARVEFVTGWEVVNSNAEALDALLNPNYDPRRHVVLQKPESTIFEMHSGTLKIPTADSNFYECDGPVQIKKITSNTHSALFSVSNHCDGYLVFSEPFYPGWRVSVDGKPIPIWRANLAFSAIFLLAGEHEVKRSYRPNSLLFGVLSAVIFCVVLGVVVYKGLL